MKATHRGMPRAILVDDEVDVKSAEAFCATYNTKLCPGGVRKWQAVSKGDVHHGRLRDIFLISPYYFSYFSPFLSFFLYIPNVVFLRYFLRTQERSI